MTPSESTVRVLTEAPSRDSGHHYGVVWVPTRRHLALLDGGSEPMLGLIATSDHHERK